MLLPLIVKRLKVGWPEAKTFSAITRYIPEIVSDFEKRERREQRDREELLREEQENVRQQTERAQLEQTWRPVWNNLSPEEQDGIRQSVLSKSSVFAKHPGILDRSCLLELSRRHAAILQDQ